MLCRIPGFIFFSDNSTKQDSCLFIVGAPPCQPCIIPQRVPAANRCVLQPRPSSYYFYACLNMPALLMSKLIFFLANWKGGGCKRLTPCQLNGLHRPRDQIQTQTYYKTQKRIAQISTPVTGNATCSWQPSYTSVDGDADKWWKSEVYRRIRHMKSAGDADEREARHPLLYLWETDGFVARVQILESVSERVSECTCILACGCLLLVRGLNVCSLGESRVLSL